MTEGAPRSFVLIANPAAGKGRGQVALSEVEDVLRGSGCDVETLCTAGPGDAIALAESAASSGRTAVVAVGGDGTLHEVLNGLMRTPVDDRPALGLVPVGTGNDYARMLRVPGRDAPTAARILRDGAIRRVDVGRLEGGDRGPEFFCNNVGLAFMADANAAHEKTRALPGRLSYSLGGAGAFLRFKADPLTVDVDGVSISGRFMIVHVGLGKYCGGGVCLTPDAALDNGTLDVCVVAERSKLKGFLQWPQLSKGLKLDDVTVLRGARIRIHGPRDMLAHADGEVRRVPTGVLVLTLLPGRLDLIHGF
jgi:YegS/Rv2252/BmrU family lipid kinase